MGSTRRNLLVGLGGLIAGGGALIGTGALNTFTAQRDADIPITNDSDALVAIEVGDGANPNDSNSIISVENGNLGIDFTRGSSQGVQPDATYQVGGIDMDKQPVIDALDNSGNSPVSESGYPSPLDRGNAKDDPAIAVRNNSSQLLGISASFDPGTDFPQDGRVLIVTRDRASSTGGGNMRAKLYGPSGQVDQGGGTTWRPAAVGESVGISLWFYTGTDQNADMSGALRIVAIDDSGGETIGDQ